MKDTLAIFVMLTILVTSLVGGGVWFGMRYERKIWEAKLPPAMDALCVSCQEAGQETGFSEGKAAGLSTCDDVLNNVDDGGHR